jgi:hypothetical protein
MLCVIMLRVVILNVIMPNVVAPKSCLTGEPRLCPISCRKANLETKSGTCTPLYLKLTWKYQTGFKVTNTTAFLLSNC